MSAVDDLLARGRLQRVSTDRSAVERLLEDADLHLATAGVAVDAGDLAGAFQLGYDAARKSLTPLLASHGLRLRGTGAHANLIAAARDLLADEAGKRTVSRLDRLRRTRNTAEYEGHWFDRDEVSDGLSVARAIVDVARAALPPS